MQCYLVQSSRRRPAMRPIATACGRRRNSQTWNVEPTTGHSTTRTESHTGPLQVSWIRNTAP